MQAEDVAQQHAVSEPEALREERRSGEDERPQDEDLALDREGPEVLEGAGLAVVRGVVVGGLGLQEPVLDVEQGGPALGDHFQPAGPGQEENACGEYGYQDGDGGRDEAPEKVQPVFEEGHRPALLVAAHKLQSHEEGRDQQEHVHTAGDPAQPDVVAHDHQHGQGP